MMDKQALEQEIQDKGLTAPRVTLDSLTCKIAYVEYMTYVSRSGKVMRWAVLEMENGFIVTGRPSVAASSENDDEELGRKLAYNNAVNILWGYEGYLLSQQLYDKKDDAATGTDLGYPKPVY